MKILNTHRLFYFLQRYETAINEAPYMPKLYEKAEEFRAAIEREVVDEALQADAQRMREALIWYRDEAAALAKHMQSGAHTQAVLASLTVLSLDAGQRADAAMALDKS
jgi:hypothetical protein